MGSAGKAAKQAGLFSRCRRNSVRAPATFGTSTADFFVVAEIGFLSTITCFAVGLSMAGFGLGRS